jgi:hypothetical protein
MKTKIEIALLQNHFSQHACGFGRLDRQIFWYDQSPSLAK